MSLSKYELIMLEEKNKQEKFKAHKRRVSIIVSIAFIMFLLAFLYFMLKDRVSESMDEINQKLTNETAKPKD